MHYLNFITFSDSYSYYFTYLTYTANMMAIQTAYQAYNELHPPTEEPHLHDDEEKSGIIHDIKESVKEVVHQITGKDNDHSESENLVENEVTPAVAEDDEMPEFSRTGYINHTTNTFTPQGSFDTAMPETQDISRPRPPSRRTSKTDRELISQAGDEILEIKVVPTHTFLNSGNGNLVDAGKFVEVLCEPDKQEN